MYWILVCSVSLYYKVKHTKTNFQPSSLNQYMCARAMPRAKKGQQKVPILGFITAVFSFLKANFFFILKPIGKSETNLN